MFHSTYCEILGDLLPHNVTVQYTNNGTPALSFLLRTFENQPQLMANSIEQIPAPQVTLWEQNTDNNELTHTSFSEPFATKMKDDITLQSNTQQQPKLIQYHRCIMLHLTMDQIRTYSQLLTSHKEYTIYVTGRLLPASSVLTQNSHNAALPTGINTTEINLRHQGLYYKKKNTFNYQQPSTEQDTILVVENLSLISPEIQAQSYQMQATIQQCKKPNTVAAAFDIATPDVAITNAYTPNTAIATAYEDVSMEDINSNISALTAPTVLPVGF